MLVYFYQKRKLYDVNIFHHESNDTNLVAKILVYFYINTVKLNTVKL
jgi:hypothetical protein